MRSAAEEEEAGRGGAQPHCALRVLDTPSRDPRVGRRARRRLGPGAAMRARGAALYAAAKAGDGAAVAAALRDGDVDPNAGGEDGWTPLMTAVRAGRARAGGGVRLMLPRDAAGRGGARGGGGAAAGRSPRRPGAA